MSDTERDARAGTRVKRRALVAFRENRALLSKLGPGLVTGAADDDPSGIATYSQGGAQFGYSVLWTVLFTYPLMVAIQLVSARIGAVTGHGLAANMRRYYPMWLTSGVVCLLLVANTINIAADIGAMAAALNLLIGGSIKLYALAFSVGSLALQTLVPFPRYSPVLKALTLALFAYVATAFVVHVPWPEVMIDTILPRIRLDPDYIVTIVAIFGTTISPYLFFWQASQEVEEQHARGDDPLKRQRRGAREHLSRIKLDTYLGMGFSNVVAFFVMLTAAVTLHANGVTAIQTSQQAAEALRPIAGPFASAVFAAGIIGTGLLAVPVLAGSAAYAVAETFGWPIGLGLNMLEARGFYSILAVATLLGVAIDFTPIDPIQALFWSAVINGVIAVPIMAVMMRMSGRTDVMGVFTVKGGLKALGWFATAVMAAVVAAMFATML